jgi:hypothetical protein
MAETFSANPDRASSFLHVVQRMSPDDVRLLRSLLTESDTADGAGPTVR